MNEAETYAEHRVAGQGWQSTGDNARSRRQAKRPTDAATTETQRLESLYQRKLSTLDALKKSLLHQAFSGAL